MPLNLVTTTSKNYAGVQDHILSLVKNFLPPGSYSQSVEEYRQGAFNFSLFINQPADAVMSHGAADKSYFFRRHENGGRISNSLKHVLVPGEWLRSRIINSKKLTLSADQVHAVGWPRLDDLLARQAAMAPDEVAGRRKRILWAPTHDYARRGEDLVSLSSYPEFEPYLERLSERYDVQTSLHPRNRPDKVPTSDKLLWADYVVSDFGTMVYEAWALGKPVIFPDWLIKERIAAYLPKGSAESHVFREGIGLHPASFEELCEMVEGGAGIDAVVSEFLDAYLSPEYRGRSSERIAQLLLRFSAELR
ncbi:MAG: CDP-glycerol glycerophosphotransferase family protein [Luteimonas sp.]|nr:CDP-glycerol glycerophosphotransferase family protein [Luteimonas sp.]